MLNRSRVVAALISHVERTISLVLVAGEGLAVRITNVHLAASQLTHFTKRRGGARERDRS